MPPNTGNRIGLGVGYEDPGNTTISNLREVLGLIRSIKQEGANLPALAAGRGSGSPGRQRQEQLAINDRAEAQHADSAKRRASDVANHQIAEGRRASDAMAFFAKKTGQELNSLYTTYRMVGQEGLAKQVETEIAHRMATTNPYGPGGVNDPNSPANKALLENVRRRQTHTQQPPTQPHLASTPVVAREQGFETRAAEIEATQTQRERWRQQWIRSQQRKSTIEEYKFEQQQTRTLGQIRAEQEALPSHDEIEIAADVRDRRRRVNQAINERAAAKQQARAAEEQAGMTLLREQAADMQRRTREAETSADYALGLRQRPATPLEQKFRRQDAEEIRLREERANQRQYEAEAPRRAAEEQADRARREAIRVKQEEQTRRDNEEAARRRADQVETQRRAREEERYGARTRLGPPEHEEQLTRERLDRARRVTGYKEAAQTPQEATVELDKMRDRVISLQREFSQVSVRRVGTELGREAGVMSRELGQVQQRLMQLKRELQQPANMRRTEQEITQEMAHLRREFAETQERARVMKSDLAQAGPPERPPNPFENSPRRRGLFGFGGGGGFGSAIANMAMYGGLYKGIALMKELTQASLENAKAQSEAELGLQGATQQAGMLASENEKIVESLQRQGQTSRTISLQAVAAATRFATQAGRPGEEGGLTRIFANIAASRGLSNEKIPELIDQAMKERGRFAQEYLGTTPTHIFTEYVRTHRGELEEGFPEKRTLAQDVAGLSDLEKRRALIDAIEARQGQFTGALSNRMDTIAGKAEAARAGFDNITASMGQMILASRNVSMILDLITNAMGGPSAGANAPGTGPGGLLTMAEIQQRAQGGFGTGQFLAGAAIRLLPTLTGAQNIYAVGQAAKERDASRLLDAIPVVGAFTASYKAQKIADASRDDLEQMRLARVNMDAFLQMQKAGRVIRVDASGREYTQQQYEKASITEKQALDASFKFGERGYRIESTEEYQKRRKGQYDELIKLQGGLNREEAIFNEQLDHRQQALAKLTQIQISLPSVQEQFGTAAAPDNPFVKSFMQLDTVIERVKGQWGGFSGEVQEGFIQNERANALFDIQKTRIEGNIAAFRSLSEAKMLAARAQVELSASDERGLTILGAQLRAAERIPQLYLEIKTLGQFRAPTAFEQEQAGRWQLDRLRGLQQFGFGPGGRARERVADEALGRFVGQYPIEMLRGARTPFARQLRDTRIQLDQREISRAYQDIIDETRKAEIGGRAAQEAQELVKSLPAMRVKAAKDATAQGLRGAALESYTRRVDDFVRSQVLAITRSLGERELTPDLRSARIAALKEDAADRLRLESEAQQTRQQTMVFIAQILAEIQAYRRQIGQQGTAGYDVAIRVENETLARADVKNLKELRTGFAIDAEPRANRVNKLAADLGMSIE